MFPPFLWREPKFWKFQKGGNLKNDLGGGNQKGGGDFGNKGGTKLFKLNLGIEKDKICDFHRQISMNFFKVLPAQANNISSLDIYCTYHA